MTFAEAMTWQAELCERGDAPITARVCRAIGGALDGSSRTGRRAIAWSGDYRTDAVPLRLVAPFHALTRAKVCPALDPLFATPAPATASDIAAIRTAITAHDDWIAAWLEGPPQTNEPGRSATFMAALLVLADRFGLPFDLLEIGSSAGLNLLIDRYRYDLGGVTVGPPASPITIRPEWRGAAPPRAAVEIRRVRGVDVAPIEVADSDAAQRLLAYIWVDATERFVRAERAIALVREQRPDLVAGDAANWVEARLAEPQDHGTTRVLMHSIVWQYLGPARQARIDAAMATAGAAATPARPLAWVAFETDHATGCQSFTLRSWPGNRVPVTLGTAHPHGAWIASAS